MSVAASTLPVSREMLPDSPTAALDAVTGGSAPIESDQILAHFIDSYVSVGKDHGDLKQLASLAWIMELPTLKGTDETLDTALLALSTADLGRDRKDPVLLHRAASMYGTALVRLHNALGDPLKAKKLPTLITCLTLILYQIIGEYPAKEHWMSHVKGMAELVRLRGPSAYSEGTDNLILRSCRVNMILGALCALQPTFLSSDQWRSVPWGASPRTDYDAMIDLMSFLPSLLSRCVSLRSLSGARARHLGRLRLVHDCWDLEEKFGTWYNQLPSNVKRTTITDTDQELLGSAAPNAAFPKSYMFTSLSAAHMHMMYWASLQVIYNMIKLLLQASLGIETTYYWPDHPAALRCPSCFAAFKVSPDEAFNGCRCGFIAAQTKFSVSEVWPLEEGHASTQTASNICMSIQYCLEQNFKLMGPYYTLFPLKMAIGGFTSCLPAAAVQLRWCYAMVDMLETKGLRFSKKMLGVYEGRQLGGFGG